MKHGAGKEFPEREEVQTAQIGEPSIGDLGMDNHRTNERYPRKSVNVK